MRQLSSSRLFRILALAVVAVTLVGLVAYIIQARVQASQLATTSCAQGSILTVVAHQDDDLLFMNPAIDQAIAHGECVRTVFLTAGDDNLGAVYAAQREAGSESAYAYMAGMADRWQAGSFTSNGHHLALYTLQGDARISLIFMRLHERVDAGYTTLTTLWDDSATRPITNLAGSDSYTRADLIATLTSILNQTAPTTLNTQDPTAVFEPGIAVNRSSVSDHPDHIAGAQFAQAAWEQAAASIQLHQYRCDNISDAEPDLYGAAPGRKATIFDTYYRPHDVQATDSVDYKSWFTREYLAHQYTHTVTGDFTGSGKTELLSFYNVDSAQRTQARLFVGAGAGAPAQWKVVWDSGEHGWDWNRTVVLSGDFTGVGRTEALAFYDVPNDFDHTRAYLFTDSSQGVMSPQLVWDSGVGQWDWGRAIYLTGDFTGDGRTDVLAFYQSAGVSHTRALLFAGSPTGLRPPVVVWDSGVGQWDWSRATYVAGDFAGAGKTDVLAFSRDDATGHVTSWLFKGTGAPTAIAAPKRVWDSGAASFDLTDARFIAGDFNGDGHTDALVFYQTGAQAGKPGHTEALEFAGTASGVAPTVVWDAGAGQWDATRAYYLAGAFTSDGHTDVLAFYRAGDPDYTILLVSALTPSGLGSWTPVWISDVNGWDWAASH